MDYAVGSQVYELVMLLKDAPHSYLYMIRQILTDNDSGTDWTRGVVRPVFSETWILFLVVHIIVSVLGALSSIAMCVDIIRRKWHKTNTGKYLLNLGINNSVIAMVEVPMNFVVMLFENWIFGGMFCYTAAVVPYVLVHSCMITFIVMISDRYRYIAHPDKKQINIIVALVVIWVSSICTASPILAYIHYRDISHLHAKLRNNGLCWSTGDNYSRVVFSCVYTLPLLILILLLTKISSELKTQKALNHLHHNQAGKDGRPNNADDAADDDVNSMIGEDSKEQFKDTSWLQRQQCTQQYLTLIIILWSVCWLPIKLFGMINFNNMETDDNMNAIDLAHMIFLPVAAICTITTPICYKLMTRKFDSEPYQWKSESDPCYDVKHALVSAESSTTESNNSSKTSNSSFIG